MSDGTKGGWKLVFRDDEIETLRLALAHVIGRQEHALEARNSTLNEIDLMAHRISKVRVQEILDYVNSVCG